MYNANNWITLIGHITNEPALKKISDHTYKTYFVLAVSREQTNKNEKLNNDYIPICFLGKKAEDSYNKLKKGKKIIIFGQLQIRKIMKDKKEIFVEVVANNFNILEPDNTESV